MRVRYVVLSLSLFLASTVPAAAQAPATPKIWTVIASAGLALTSGNTDTSTVNAAYEIAYDPQTRNAVKSDGLLIRGKNNGTVNANRLNLNARDEFKLSTRSYLFGQNQYLKDEFKNIDYLLAPTGGVGYKLFDSDTSKMSIDAGIGGVWEKNPGIDVRSSGALTVGEKLSQALTANATLSQTFMGLWKTKDLDDALYTFGIGIAASMSTRTQLKVELLDTYKNLPPVATVKKNDVAILMAIVYKI